MKKLIGSIVVPLVLVAGWLSLPTPPAAGENIDEFPEGNFVVRAARVFTGESVLAPGVVVVRDGMIEQVGETVDVPEDLPLLDLGDRTLLPGLIDAHVHVFGAGAEEALNFGVTTILDQTNDAGQIAALKRAGSGAQIFSSGPPATAPGGHGTQYGFEVPVIEGPDDAADFVREITASGSDWMKIIVERGWGERRLPHLDQATVEKLVAEAKRADMLVAVHATEQETARWAEQAGADGYVHVFADEPIDADLARDIAARDMFMIPTLVVQESIAGMTADEFTDEPEIAEWLTGGQRASLNQSFGAPRNPAIRQRALENTRALLDAGVPILAGSDAPNPGTAQGVSLHRELQLLVEAGLSPEQALAAATILPAKHFHLDDRGSLAPGRRADLLAVDGNPLENIAATTAIHAVWQQGRFIARVPAGEMRGDAVPEHGRLSAFTADEADAGFGAGWAETTDQRAGGQSTVSMASGADGELPYIRLRGEIMQGFAWPWAGAMAFTGEQPMAPADLSAFSQLVFRARGDFDMLRVLVFSPELGGMPSTQTVSLTPEWNQFRVELAAFDGADPAAIQGIAFSAGPDLGAFEFDLADVRLE